MLRYALAATAILAGLVVFLAAFEEPFLVTPRPERPVVVQAAQSNPNASSVVSVTSEQTRLQSEMDARARALRSAATHQLEELEAVVAGPKAPQTAAPAGSPSAPRAVAPSTATRHHHKRHRSSALVTWHN